MQNSLSGPSHYGGWGEKIAIPKLDRGPPPPSKMTERNKEDRAVRACKICRKRKVKCSGDLPSCSNCQLNDSICVYEQARRDRLKDAMQLNQEFSALLISLREDVDEENKKKINDALDEAEGDLISPVSTMPTATALGKRARKQPFTSDYEEAERRGEAHVTASVGSNEDLEFVGEDLMRSRESRETGYIGQNSEIQWLRSVERQSGTGNTDPRRQRFGPPGSSKAAVNERSEALHERRKVSQQGSLRHITDATFYLDSDNLEVDFAVDNYEMPDTETAERLFKCYNETVHSTFALVPASFEDQFRRFIKSLRQNKPYQIPDKWRATLNLLFAIGAKFSHLIGAEWRGDERDHLIYMTRAINLLGIKSTVMIISGPDLALVQATGALAFYFLVIGHVSKAWIMIGFSIRLGLSLGLHLRNEDPSADSAKREPLARVWWGLHSIECLVSSITGRPPVISSEDCTVPLPETTSERNREHSNSRRTSRVRTRFHSPETPQSSAASESSQRGSPNNDYLVSYIKITLISQEVLVNLYSPRTAKQSWEYVQNKITELLNELETWVSVALPGNRSPQTSARSTKLDRERLILQCYYWSIKILITRPCLCRLERRIQHESDSSINFNFRAAETCVEAAQQLTKLFPDPPDLTFIYTTGPWWSLVHFIMQSLAVLLLEIAYEEKHKEPEKDAIAECIKKMLRWLHVMKFNNSVAARAYLIIRTIIKTCAPPLQDRAKDLLAHEDDYSQEASPQQQGPYPFDQQQSAQWQQPNFENDSLRVQETFDPQFFHDHLNPLVDYESNYFMSDYIQMPTSFGNPFVTSFDQGAPVVNMHDTWSTTAPSGDMGMYFTGMDLSQNQPQQYFPGMSTFQDQQHQQQHARHTSMQHMQQGDQAQQDPKIRYPPASQQQQQQQYHQHPDLE